jgi:hypothetical protein
MIFILHFGYSLATVTPYNQCFVNAIKVNFENGFSDYRRDSRVWLFDEQHEGKVLKLVAEHFPDAIIKHFVDRAELVEV